MGSGLRVVPQRNALSEWMRPISTVMPSRR
jgi:hypothetical protein